MSVSLWGSHTAQQYSSFGRIVARYSLPRVWGGDWQKRLCTKPSWRLAFLQVEAMCSDHDRLDEISTPRYSTEELGAMG